MAVRSAPLLSPFHRLIPVIVLSSKIPVRWRAFKESVKVRPPESPPLSDDFALDLATFHVSSHRSHSQTQHFRCLMESQQTVPNRCHVNSGPLLCCHWGFPFCKPRCNRSNSARTRDF